MTGPLKDLRVLDLSRVLAGPWCSQLLADLGAEVIKVERPGTGDDTRAWGPPWLRDEAGRDTAESAYCLCANRGKRSIALDLARPEGARIARELAAKSDVLIENYKVGALARYGLDHASLAALNPRLIYCSITGFGQDGPRAREAGYDFIVQGLGGLMSITGRPDGEPGAGPLKVGVAVTDLMTGMYAAVAVLAALAHRARSGEGQTIELALLDCTVAMLANQATNYLASGRSPGRLGNAHPNIVPYQSFAAADGDVIVAVGNDGQFRRYCEAIGRPGLADDPRFATNRARVANRAPLVALLEPIMAQRRSREWVERLEAAGVPCGPINRIEEVFADPQVIHRGMKIELEHPLAGRVSLVGNPIRMSATPIEYRDPPPLRGQHGAQILRELLGMDEKEVERLRGAGVIE
ncbi:MAG TPA: CoA transferase [Rhodocyclaceae bacterium]|nr:MAG: CoA transferase [Betaproteobacteria bacterium CG2_30_68_42]PIV74865.1 MAG: CoA transferase [Rhodocyclales bacterium CG17_big_fil_post_rev_8_21_14_2_50_68_7]PIX75529.1 MAG: CoA transferase [Rhodocyclales bacterium CG_4_10_14_3_um_filter_68_10]PJA58139.1 MAG: CoA transferase [Rhodocyclales bacterium CG_4_9_14_3_um_filter_68_10]HCX32781.1 CoA transferase [Rhodocyclaceae bacterium]